MRMLSAAEACTLLSGDGFWGASGTLAHCTPHPGSRSTRSSAPSPDAAPGTACRAHMTHVIHIFVGVLISKTDKPGFFNRLLEDSCCNCTLQTSQTAESAPRVAAHLSSRSARLSVPTSMMTGSTDAGSKPAAATYKSSLPGVHTFMLSTTTARHAIGRVIAWLSHAGSICTQDRTYADAEAVDAQVAEPLHHHIILFECSAATCWFVSWGNISQANFSAAFSGPGHHLVTPMYTPATLSARICFSVSFLLPTLALPRPPSAWCRRSEQARLAGTPGFGCRRSPQ